ncbi:MAG: TetR/AcrR family transcriptional regulator [Moraxellaceae bacterium]|nr:MAG: TetR/AcrR family transcriptional regulator [Moraxellaceae bacterium]
MLTGQIKKSDAKRLHILQTGLNLVIRKGFIGVGLQEILKNCGIPKGSFYHYFASKEAFGCELVNYYIGDYQMRLNALWENDLAKDELAYNKLINYFSLWIDDPQTQCGWADSCLIVKLAAEVADLSEDMRSIMAQGVEDLITQITSVLNQGFEDQSIKTQPNAATAAQVLYQMWLGAALLSKLQKDKAPLQHALHATQLMLNNQL